MPCSLTIFPLSINRGVCPESQTRTRSHLPARVALYVPVDTWNAFHGDGQADARVWSGCPVAGHNDAMREVAEGVIEVPITFAHAYLVVTDDGVVLVDTGLPGQSKRIRQALAETRRTVGDVRTILLTHWHADHTGAAAEL